jgi:hypothetical protein
MIPSPPPAHVQPTDITVVHDARAVYDTASLRFQEFRANGQPFWTQAVVKPGTGSGAASVPGSYINADTGQSVFPKGAQPVVTKTGDLGIVAKAPGDVQAPKAIYSWDEPFTDRRGALTAEDFYSPFVSGGTVVFRYQPGAKGMNQFQSVRLIFPNWSRDVASASSFVESHLGLLENGEQQAPQVAQLRQLLGDKNRFLVVEAFRELADGGHLDANLAFEHLTNAEAPLDAVLSYLMLISRDTDDLAQQVNAAIYASRNEKKLQSIALGAFSALLFRSQDSRIRARSKAALQRVHARVLQLKIPLDSNSYLNLIFNKAGVP